MPDEHKIEKNIVQRQPRSQKIKSKDTIIIRKVILPAVYVEKEKKFMPPTRKTSTLSMAYSDEGYLSTRSTDKKVATTRTVSTERTITRERPLSKIKSVKKCTCTSTTSPDILCQCHLSDYFERNVNDCWELSSECSSSSTETQITVFPHTSTQQEVPPIDIDTMSLTSLNTDRTFDVDPEEKKERIKQWLKKKEQEKKLKKIEEEKMQKEKEKQKQMQIEQKKQVYKQWLEKKKEQEERIKRTKQRTEVLKKKEEVEKMKKHSEGEEMFQAWLKIKKKEELQKKLSKKMQELKEYEEKKKRMEENQRAFHEWLKNSKDKPKPVPLNKGLSSLCSSASVSYVNPEPWIGNVESKSYCNFETDNLPEEEPNWFMSIESRLHSK